MEISTRCEKKMLQNPHLSPLPVSPEYSGSTHYFQILGFIFTRQEYTITITNANTETTNPAAAPSPSKLLWLNIHPSICMCTAISCEWFIFTGSCLSCSAVPWSVPEWGSGSSWCCGKESPPHRRSKWPQAPLTCKYKVKASFKTAALVEEGIWLLNVDKKTGALLIKGPSDSWLTQGQPIKSKRGLTVRWL